MVQTLLIPFLKYDGYQPWELPRYAFGALYLTDVHTYPYASESTTSANGGFILPW